MKKLLFSFLAYCVKSISYLTFFSAAFYLIIPVASAAAATLSASTSFFTTRLDDPKAIYLSKQEFGAVGDGIADDTTALQAAIDKAENHREGILFIPSGRYRLTRSLYIWPGVRVIGYGATRPLFLLGDNTPGFQEGVGTMVIFTGARTRCSFVKSCGSSESIANAQVRSGAEANATPAASSSPSPSPSPSPIVSPFGVITDRIPFPPLDSVPANSKITDANQNTFYSAMSNIDFQIGEGNPAAIAIRFHVAQHSFLSHMNFHIGSGLAALTEVGNEADDLHIYGGRFGIFSDKTTPAWQFTLIDSEFDGQRETAIREHDLGLTLVRTHFRNMPTAIEIDADYADQIWVKDSRFENISKAAFLISNEKNPLTGVHAEGAILHNTPVMALMRESGTKILSKGPITQVKQFSHGLMVPGLGQTGKHGTIYEASELKTLPAVLPRALVQLPSTSAWKNVHELGVKGDGKTDDTLAIQKAIESHTVLYFPSGHYIVSDTLNLKPNSIIIGLHPTATQFDLLDSTPGYQAVGSPKAVLFAPQGGANVMSGFGVFTGGINPRAVPVLWKSGVKSMINDVRFLGGHGSGSSPYNNNHTADPDLTKRWDGQYPSLWVTDGGGGTFVDIWSPNTFAQSGFFVSHTKTPGFVYEMSVEHHVRNEIKFDHVENWEVYAPQTEEEIGESPESVSLEINHSKNITFANYHGYRVTRSRAPFPASVRIYNSENIRFRNVHVNAEHGYAGCDSAGCFTFVRAGKYSYENAIQDMTSHLEVREHEFALLDIPAKPPVPSAADATAVVEPQARVEQLETGFFSIAGAAVDDAGKLFFVDRHQQRIYSWSRAEGLGIERDHPLDPVNLAFDKSGNLLVLSSYGAEGTVYSFRPGSTHSDITLIAPQKAQAHKNALMIFPANYWNDGQFKNHLDFSTFRYTTIAEMLAQDVSIPKEKEYVSLDGSVFLPAGRVINQGAADHTGWRFSDNLDTYGFLRAAPGSKVYVSHSSEDKTYSAQVEENGTLSHLRLFAERGGESVAVDAKGNVYIANGQVFVYNPQGEPIAQIDVPERPLNLIFGGDKNQTLFMLAHHSLYSVKIKN